VSELLLVVPLSKAWSDAAREAASMARYQGGFVNAALFLGGSVVERPGLRPPKEGQRVRFKDLTHGNIYRGTYRAGKFVTDGGEEFHPTAVTKWTPAG